MSRLPNAVIALKHLMLCGSLTVDKQELVYQDDAVWIRGTSNDKPILLTMEWDLSRFIAWANAQPEIEVVGWVAALGLRK